MKKREVQSLADIDDEGIIGRWTGNTELGREVTHAILHRPKMETIWQGISRGGRANRTNG